MIDPGSRLRARYTRPYGKYSTALIASLRVADVGPFAVQYLSDALPAPAGEGGRARYLEHLQATAAHELIASHGTKR